MSDETEDHRQPQPRQEPEPEPKRARRAVDPRLLEMLACPLTKMPLSWNAASGELVSRAARLAFPVRDGVPIMLPSEARRLEEDELS